MSLLEEKDFVPSTNCCVSHNLSAVLAEINSLDPTVYGKIDLDRLTAYGLKFLQDNSMECTFENLVVVLFKLFPQKFSLVGFPNYPDSHRVHNCIDLHCRPKYKDYATGSKQKGWKLSDKGRAAAEEVERILQGVEAVSVVGRAPRLTVRERTKALLFLREVKNGAAFQKYVNGERMMPPDLRDLLHGSAETPPHILETNLERLVRLVRDAVATYDTPENRSVLGFLNYVKSNFKALVHE